MAPIHFYTYEQAPTITTTKTNKQSKKPVETDLSQNIYRASTIANIEYYKQELVISASTLYVNRKYKQIENIM